MEISEIRRARLREWYENRAIPEKEKSYISQLMSGKASFGERAARRLERDYGMGDKYLDQMEAGSARHVSEPHAPYNIEPGPGLAGRVPLISWVQAGDWQEVIDNEAPGQGEMIETSYRARRHTYALRVKGDSMQPRFPEGAILIIEPEEEAMPGKFVVVRQNGDSEATFKQLISDGGRLYLKPLNERYPILELRQDAVFCGVVKRVEMDV